MPGTNVTAPTPAQVGSPQVGPAPVQPQGMGTIPFRLATLARKDVIDNFAQLIGTTEFTYDRVLPGTGYLSDVDIFVNTTGSSNAAAANVAYAEDAPYNVLSSVILNDVTGQIINLDGWSLKTIARYGSWEPFPTGNLEHATYGATTTNSPPITGDSTYVEQKVAGTGTTGGTFLFHAHVPVTLNTRDLVGLLGNQDRSQQYTLRTNVNTSANVYTTPPGTTLPTINYTRNYHSYAIPNEVNDSRQQQQVTPPTYGTISYLTKSISPSIPVGGSQINHYLSRVGNAIRVLALVWRQAGSRASAEPNLPTNLQVKIGDQIVYNEGPASRRRDMWDAFGFDSPNGTLVYFLTNDFGVGAGSELYHMWWWTENVVQMQINATYPTAFGNAGTNSLTVITSDVIVPPNVNIYQPI